MNLLHALPLWALALVCGQVSHLIAIWCKPIANLPLLRCWLIILQSFNLLESTTTTLLEHHLIVHTLEVGQVLIVLLLQ